jgi:hypothetical protein
MGLRARVHNYVRLFARPHRRSTLITLAVVAAVSMVLAAINVFFHLNELESDSRVGFSTFIFFEAIVLWCRQVWITDDYDKAERAAAEAENVRREAGRQSELRKMPPASAAFSYSVLELNENATDMEIKTAFRRLVKRYHPDRGRYSALANAEKFRQVQEAYAILRNHRGLSRH